MRTPQSSWPWWRARRRGGGRARGPGGEAAAENRDYEDDAPVSSYAAAAFASKHW